MSETRRSGADDRKRSYRPALFRTARVRLAVERAIVCERRRGAQAGGKDEGGRMKDESTAVRNPLLLHPSAFILHPCLRSFPARAAALVRGDLTEEYVAHLLARHVEVHQ